MASDRLSAIITTYSGSASLRRCLRSLEQPRSTPDQLVIVQDGLLDAAGPPATTPGCRVLRVDARCGVGAARNAGAYAADGEILAFLDGDTIVRPGWADALRAAFADGACLAGGGIDSATPPSWAGGWGSRWRPHDPQGRNGFLPFVSGAHLVIRRDVFLRLGGFDERMPLAEDVDLSLRAQLAGYPIAFIPAAQLVEQTSASVGGLLGQRLRRAGADRMIEQRFRKFPFMTPDTGNGVGRAFMSSAAAVLLTGTGGDARRLSLPFLHAGLAAAARLGALATDVQMATRLRPLPGAVDYRDPEQHNTSSPLPGAPTFLLLGDDRLLMALLRLACEGGDHLIVAPPGLEREAIAMWDRSAPWSLRLVRMAVRAGWPLALETAAMRVEREQPRTWGEAFLTLHRVHAWAHERPRFGLAALGPSGHQLAQRLPDVPIVMAGQGDPGHDRVLLRVTRRRVLHDRDVLGAELSQLIGPTSGRGGGAPDLKWER